MECVIGSKYIKIKQKFFKKKLLVKTKKISFIKSPEVKEVAQTNIDLWIQTNEVPTTQKCQSTTPWAKVTSEAGTESVCDFQDSI